MITTATRLVLSVISYLFGTDSGWLCITTIELLGFSIARRENSRVAIRKNWEFKDKMGGNKKRFEPASCSDWKKNKDVWEILQDGGLNVFMERLCGKDPTVTKHFIKNWKCGKILVGT